MNKLDMAHEIALAIQSTKLIHDMELVSDMAWKYADAMQAEADKRSKAEVEQKRKAVREMLNADNTFLEKEGQHFDDVEWQPDWSQAPDGYKWRAFDGYSKGANWYNLKPWIDDDSEVEDEWNADLGSFLIAPSFGYKGGWKDSLRKRP